MVLTKRKSKNWVKQQDKQEQGQNKKVLKQLDNRTMMYFFAEIISYYYGLHLEKK